jgi:hypothetical protein
MAFLLALAAEMEVTRLRIADWPATVVGHESVHRLALLQRDDVRVSRGGSLFLDCARYHRSHRFLPDLCEGTAKVDVTVAGAPDFCAADFFGLRTSLFDFC